MSNTSIHIEEDPTLETTVLFLDFLKKKHPEKTTQDLAKQFLSQELIQLLKASGYNFEK